MPFFGDLHTAGGHTGEGKDLPNEDLIKITWIHKRSADRSRSLRFVLIMRSMAASRRIPAGAQHHTAVWRRTRTTTKTAKGREIGGELALHKRRAADHR